MPIDNTFTPQKDMGSRPTDLSINDHIYRINGLIYNYFHSEKKPGFENFHIDKDDQNLTLSKIRPSLKIAQEAIIKKYSFDRTKDQEAVTECMAHFIRKNKENLTPESTSSAPKVKP